MKVNISLRGLKSILEAFDMNGNYVKRTRWTIGSGGYDLLWQLSYDGIPVIDCIGGSGLQKTLHNLCLEEEVYDSICDIIMDVYGKMKKSD
jgi:hypothetical protein